MSYDSFEIPDSITPILGYRGWTYKDGFLYSCYRSVKWPTDTYLKSECIHPTFSSLSEKHVQDKKVSYHAYPTKECSCGIYALHEFPSTYTTKDGDGNRRRTPKPWPHYALSGLVLSWGHIVMGDKGFRAEYSKPVALLSRPRSKSLKPIIEELASNYDIDIVDLKEIKKNGYWKAE